MVLRSRERCRSAGRDSFRAIRFDASCCCRVRQSRRKDLVFAIYQICLTPSLTSFIPATRNPMLPLLELGRLEVRAATR